MFKFYQNRTEQNAKTSFSSKSRNFGAFLVFAARLLFCRNKHTRVVKASGIKKRKQKRKREGRVRQCAWLETGGGGGEDILCHNENAVLFGFNFFTSSANSYLTVGFWVCNAV